MWRHYRSIVTDSSDGCFTKVIRYGFFVIEFARVKVGNEAGDM